MSATDQNKVGTGPCLPLRCITSSFYTTLSVQELRRPVTVILKVEYSHFRCRKSAAQQFVVTFVQFYISECTKHFPWVTSRDCRQVSFLDSFIMKPCCNMSRMCCGNKQGLDAISSNAPPYQLLTTSQMVPLILSLEDMVSFIPKGISNFHLTDHSTGFSI